jgi:hypothetical protein
MSAMRLRRAVAIASIAISLGALATATVPACTGEWSFALPPVEGGAPDPRYADACAAWAQAYCDFHRRCDGFFFTWLTVGQCESREQTFCQLSATDPNVVFDAQRLASCRYPDDCNGTLPACWPPGIAATGAPCLQSQDCHSSICSGAQAVQSVCGVCACGDGCAANEVCSIDADGGTCVPVPAAPSAPCSADGDCASDLCVVASGSDAGACAPYVDAGGSCAPPSALCNTGLYCGIDELCAAAVRVGYGASCGFPSDGGTWTFCTTGASCVGGACMPPTADGEECDPASGVSCLFPAKCVDRHCVFPTLSACSP